MNPINRYKHCIYCHKPTGSLHFCGERRSKISRGTLDYADRCDREILMRMKNETDDPAPKKQLQQPISYPSMDQNYDDTVAIAATTTTNTNTGASDATRATLKEAEGDEKPTT